MTDVLDFAKSPYTGWTRGHWENLADGMLTAVAPYRSPSGARIELPGPVSVSGEASDGLEGFARSFLIAGFLVAGRNGADRGNLLEAYARGLAAGTDPASPEAWPRPDVLGQAKVEAASVALTLQLTRTWLWDRLDDRVRERTVEWLSGVIGQPYPPTNWVWFRIIVESFLREAGGPWSASDIEEDLAVHASMRRANGWLSDGPGRGFDHYVGWTLHLYPLLWQRLFDVTGTLCSPELGEQWATDLGRYTDDALHLIGSDGSPLLQGRSLIYRFAAAAPLWMAALSGARKHPPGLLRRAASGIVSHFVDHGALDPDGLLSLGWHGAWPQMRQVYSGSGSPYWAAKGMLGLLLPEDHPVWTDREQPLPIEAGDVARVVEAPGWLVSGRRTEGIVTVLNHGTDHAHPGATSADAPLYARLGYSTASVPPLTGPTTTDPLDNAVVLLDQQGRASHRTGFSTLFTRELPDGVLAAASQGPVRWVDTTADTSPDYGAGRGGTVTPGPTLTVASVVRNGVEVRVARVDTATTAPRLRMGGWPVASARPLKAETDHAQPLASAAREDLCSTVRGLRGLTEAGVAVDHDVSPLGEYVAVPWLASTDVSPGELVIAVVTLSRTPMGEPVPVVTVRRDADGHHHITIAWNQGIQTEITLPA